MPESSLRGSLSLPLIAPEPEAAAPPDWHGWSPVEPLPAVDAPEPVEPQGAYQASVMAAPLELPELAEPATRLPVELLAPAGGPDAAFAAFHFGADAIYLGLKK